MPPPSDHPIFRLRLLDRPLKVLQLKPNEEVPEEYIRLLTGTGIIANDRFISVTRTDEEVSVVLDSPQDDGGATWRCIKIAGPMDFDITGVMADFTAPLKAAEIPVFAVSTWNTDYILVPKESATRAVDVLSQDGWIFD
ncbi:hypothetical protein BV20DRAFT_984630 [Pilatotrama ljubarskyi]|nr:hypothetical protein BV20DRAFT_984630 [Pilatotrama ljubarskyi]